MSDPLVIVCISDTHGAHEQVALPPGDVLIHAGDVTAHGTERDWQRFVEWLGSREFSHCLFVAGNHDSFAEQHPERAAELAERAGVTWLNDTGCVIDGVHFWGSPITPRFLDWSFMRDPGEDIERHWQMIPAETDVLITHGPPIGILDVVDRADGTSEHTGCPSLANSILQLRPSYHLFGHIHEGYGRLEQDEVTYLNISTMNNAYQVANAPVVIPFTGHHNS